MTDSKGDEDINSHEATKLYALVLFRLEDPLSGNFHN